MNEHSRRTFLIATGATAAVGRRRRLRRRTGGRQRPARTARCPNPTGSAGEPGAAVVAYVSDAATGQVTVMRGEDEVVLTDHDLARRLSGEVR